MKVYIHQNGKNLGPFSLEELNNSVLDGKFKINDLACHDGKTWVKIHEVPGIELPPQGAKENPSANDVNKQSARNVSDENSDNNISGKQDGELDQKSSKAQNFIQKSKGSLKSISENINAKELNQKAKKVASDISSSDKIMDLRAKAKESIESVKSGSLAEKLKSKAQETVKRVKSGEIVQDIKDKSKDLNKKLTNSIIYVVIDGEKSGPFNPIEINNMISIGKINVSDSAYTTDTDPEGTPLSDPYFAEMGVGENNVTDYEMPEASKPDKEAKLSNPKLVRILSTVLAVGILGGTFFTWYINKATVSGYAGNQSMSSSGQVEYIGLLTFPGFFTFLSAITLVVFTWIAKLKKFTVFPLVACICFCFIGLIYEPSGASYTSKSSSGLVGGSADVYWLKGTGITISLIASILSGLFAMYAIFGNIFKVYERFYYPIFKRCMSFNPLMCLGINIFLSVSLFLLFSLFMTGSFSISTTVKMLLFFTAICIFRSSMLAVLVKFKSDLNYIQSIKKCMIVDMISLFMIVGVLQTPQVFIVDKIIQTVEDMDEIWKEHKSKKRIDAYKLATSFVLFERDLKKKSEKEWKAHLKRLSIEKEDDLSTDVLEDYYDYTELADIYSRNVLSKKSALEDEEIFEKVLELKNEIKSRKVLTLDDFKLLQTASHTYVPTKYIYLKDGDWDFDINRYQNDLNEDKEATTSEILEILDVWFDDHHYHEDAEDEYEYSLVLKEMDNKRNKTRDLPYIFFTLMIISLFNTHAGFGMLMKNRPKWLFAYTFTLHFTSFFILMHFLFEWY